MFYIRLKNGLPVEVEPGDHPKPQEAWADDIRGTGWWSSRDFETLEAATKIAGYLTFMTGKTYIAGDRGTLFQIVEAPAIGDPVSKSFNGDSYPCGHIIKITPSWIITTDEGTKFRRLKGSTAWREQGGSFWMVAGHIDERNPSF